MDAITPPSIKERPIIFSAAMVRAILEGRKTQTRRIAKDANGEVVPSDRAVNPAIYPNGTRGYLADWPHKYGPTRFLTCPYGKPGDRLWVRETFTLENDVDGMGKPSFSDGRPVKFRDESDWECNTPAWQQPHYKATDPAPDLCCDHESCRQCRDNDYGPHWMPSIHMPRWASRILLEIVSVRVERLQDIYPEDAEAEGVQLSDKEGFSHMVETPSGGRWHRQNAKAAFSDLWRDINGEESWDANPWVWVIEFKRVDA